MEEGPGEAVPRDGVGDGSEYPVQLSQWRFAVGLLAGNAVDELLVQALRPQQASAGEPSQRHLLPASSQIFSYVKFIFYFILFYTISFYFIYVTFSFLILFYVIIFLLYFSNCN